MARAKILVEEETRNGKAMLNLELVGGSDPGPVVRADFEEISARHFLPPEGGCYEVQAIVPDSGGETVSFLGGMYVQPEKGDAVLAELRARGYEISTDTGSSP